MNEKKKHAKDLLKSVKEIIGNENPEKVEELYFDVFNSLSKIIGSQLAKEAIKELLGDM